MFVLPAVMLVGVELELIRSLVLGEPCSVRNWFVV
jgi:hypothetical protein